MLNVGAIGATIAGASLIHVVTTTLFITLSILAMIGCLY